MNSKKMLAFDKEKIAPLSIIFICFGTSALLSIMALQTQGSTPFSMGIFISLAIGLELVKFYFPAVGIGTKDMNIVIRCLFVAIGLCAVYYSVSFSFVFSKNEAAAIKNTFYENSDEVKAVNKSVTDRDKLINRLDKEITALEAEKKSELSKYNPVKYRTKCANITNSYNAKIQRKSDQLTKYQGEGLKTAKTANISTVKTIDKGVSGMFDTAEQENIFFKLFAVLMEFSGVMAIIAYKRKSRKIKKHLFIYEDNEPAQEPEHENNSVNNSGKVIDIDKSKNKAQISNSSVLEDTEIDGHSQPDNYTLGQSKNLNDYDNTELKSRNKIGFQADTGIKAIENDTSLSDTDIQIYKNKMYELKEQTQKGIVSPGYIKISRETGLQQEVCRKIKGYLERTGTIKTVGSRTFIL